ncbi:MAG: hypothetical protein V3V18_15450 [Methylococcales bacterium]
MGNQEHFYQSANGEIAKKVNNFCGGLDNYAIWLEREELIKGLKHFGYSKIDEKLINNNPRHGQNILLLAQK